jgi:hypothetical protein
MKIIAKKADQDKNHDKEYAVARFLAAILVRE